MHNFGLSSSLSPSSFYQMDVIKIAISWVCLIVSLINEGIISSLIKVTDNTNYESRMRLQLDKRWCNKINYHTYG